MKKYIVLGGLMALAPSMALADAVSGVEGFLSKIGSLISAAVPIVISLAVLSFMWGLAMYLFGDKKDEAKNTMIWGIITLFVMVSIWGLVNLLSDTFGFKNQTTGGYANPATNILK